MREGKKRERKREKERERRRMREYTGTERLFLLDYLTDSRYVTILFFLHITSIVPTSNINSL